MLPPLSQPQLSLYPHIHGTSASSDITTSQVMDELGPLPTVITSKPPIFANPYLVSLRGRGCFIKKNDIKYGSLFLFIFILNLGVNFFFLPQGSDLLTEQLIREWDLAYGDALTPPGGMQPITSISSTSM